MEPVLCQSFLRNKLKWVTQYENWNFKKCLFLHFIELSLTIFNHVVFYQVIQGSRMQSSILITMLLVWFTIYCLSLKGFSIGQCKSSSSMCFFFLDGVGRNDSLIKGI